MAVKAKSLLYFTKSVLAKQADQAVFKADQGMAFQKIKSLSRILHH